MSETAAVPVIVLSRHEDNAEAINRVLRNSGRAAHVRRLDDAGDLADELGEQGCELLVVFADESDNLLLTAAAVLDATGLELPMISCRGELDEAAIATDIASGAQDAATLERMDRIEEANGTTLLDNTIFTLGAGMGDGTTHQYNDLPLVVAGGAGKLKLGSHIHCKRGTPLANLWLTQLHALGIKRERYADSSETLSEIQA